MLRSFIGLLIVPRAMSSVFLFVVVESSRYQSRTVSAFLFEWVVNLMGFSCAHSRNNFF